MGTHGCIAITKSDGTHICCERTLDGYISMGAVVQWMRNGLKESDYPSPDEIGNGVIEFNEEREHDQEYYYHVNYETKTLMMSNIPTPIWDSDDFTAKDTILLIAKYIEQGWNFESGWDCDCDCD